MDAVWNRRQIKADALSSGLCWGWLGSSSTPTADLWLRGPPRSSGTCCWRTHVALRKKEGEEKRATVILTATNGGVFLLLFFFFFAFFAITQIFGEGIITCHRCRCCFCPQGTCSRAQRAGGAFVEDAHLISAINWQLCRSQETLGLRLKAVHLLLRGRSVAAGRGGERCCAPAQVGTYLEGGWGGARACRGVGGRRKYVICGVTAN